MSKIISEVSFLRATPVLRSADYPCSRAYYTNSLGFRVVEEGGNPARFGIVERGRAVLFIDAWHGPPVTEQTGWSAYFHVSDIEELFAEYQERDARIHRPVELTNYGMREFEVVDPDGNIVCFGQDTDPTTFA